MTPQRIRTRSMEDKGSRRRPDLTGAITIHKYDNKQWWKGSTTHRWISFLSIYYWGWSKWFKAGQIYWPSDSLTIHWLSDFPFIVLPVIGLGTNLLLALCLSLSQLLPVLSLSLPLWFCTFFSLSPSNSYFYWTAKYLVILFDNQYCKKLTLLNALLPPIFCSSGPFLIYSTTTIQFGR